MVGGLPVRQQRDDMQLCVDRVDHLFSVASVQVRYINLPIEELHSYAMKTLDANQPVWFGCDCGKFMQREQVPPFTVLSPPLTVLSPSFIVLSPPFQGIFDTELFDYDLIYDAGERTVICHRRFL